MNIRGIRKILLNHIGKKVRIIYYGGRNKKEVYIGIVDVISMFGAAIAIFLSPKIFAPSLIIILSALIPISSIFIRETSISSSVM